MFLTPIRLNSFPTFCGVLIGGSTVFRSPIRALLKFIRSILPFYLRSRLSRSAWERLTRFLAAFLAAWLSFRLLNRGRTTRIHLARPESQTADAQAQTSDTQGIVQATNVGNNGQDIEFSGRTMDLTLFGVVRALDICIGELWSRHKLRRTQSQSWTRLESTISTLTDPTLFAMSASVVMWAWFYLPERLPRSYNKWIGEAAQVDYRLIEALRRARQGEFIYGKNTGQADLLEGMCQEYGWPIEWGDPEKTVPIPCEMVHMGSGPSCEKHALRRFIRAFQFALATYLPLQLVMRIKSSSSSTLTQGLKDAVRSSAFLGSFISLFYYGVCAARTRVGPKIFDPSVVTPLMWDSGLCVASGCMACGWSVSTLR